MQLSNTKIKYSLFTKKQSKRIRNRNRNRNNKHWNRPANTSKTNLS